MEVDTEGEVFLDAWRVAGKRKSKSLAERLRDAAKSRYARSWSEKDHPRGQPENAGEFRKKGSGKPARKARGKSTPTPDRLDATLEAFSAAGRKKMAKLIEAAFTEYRRGGEEVPLVQDTELNELMEWVSERSRIGPIPDKHKDEVRKSWRSAFNQHQYHKLAELIIDQGKLSSNHAAELHQIVEEIADNMVYRAQYSNENRPEPEHEDKFPELNQFRKNFERVVNVAAPKALARAAKSLKKLRFFPTIERLNKAAGTDNVAGMFSWDDQALWLDGHNEEETNDMRHVYAHEFWHAVDWNGGNWDSSTGTGEGHLELSSTPAWMQVMQDEILPQGEVKFMDGWWYKRDGIYARPIPPEEYALTAYAATKPAEGFAEFGRLVLNNPLRAKEKFPKAWKFFESEGLV